MNLLCVPIAALLLAGNDERFQQLLDKGEFLAAWTLSAETDDPIQRARQRAQLLLKAGDPAGALAVARGGRLTSPDDLDLLYHETTAAVWLREGQLARGTAERLLAALDRSPVPLGDRSAWQQAARRRLEESYALIDLDVRLERSIARAKAIALSVITAALLVALAARAALRRDQGRSSNPVS